MSKVIDRTELQALLGRGAQLVEVLPAREYEEDHIPGAICMPLSKIDRERVKALDRSRPVITYCWDTA
jgi:rhodanese-related sulfurtransferase